MLKYVCCQDFSTPGICKLCGKKRIRAFDEDLIKRICAEINLDAAIFSQFGKDLEYMLFKNAQIEFWNRYSEFLIKNRLIAGVKFRQYFDEALSSLGQNLLKLIPVDRIDFPVAQESEIAVRNFIQEKLEEILQLDALPVASAITAQKLRLTAIVQSAMNVLNILSKKQLEIRNEQVFLAVESHKKQKKKELKMKMKKILKTERKEEF